MYARDEGATIHGIFTIGGYIFQRQIRLIIYPFRMYNKSAADYFENLQEKLWKVSVNESILIEMSWNKVAEEGIAHHG